MIGSQTKPVRRPVREGRQSWTFTVERQQVFDMLDAEMVDWDAVVRDAIAEKLATLRQRQVATVATRTARRDPSPEEIAARCREVRGTT